jgi:DNA-binding MarR family transcriptional regulator
VRRIDRGPLPGFFGYNLRIAQTAVFAHFASTVGEVDGDEISPGRFSLLALLGFNPGINQTDLSRAVGLDKSTLTPALDQLERKGIIIRERTAADRRTYALSLSPKGHALLARLLARVEKHEEAIVAPLTANERTTLLRLLRKIARGLRSGAL